MSNSQTPSKLFSDLYAACYSPANATQKSSHWAARTSRFSVENGKVNGIAGFSSRSIRIPFLTYYLHAFLQFLNFRNFYDAILSKWYGSFDTVLSKQGRSLDNDAYRHVCTFTFLEKYINFSSIDTVCVIGDGQANFVSPLLARNTFSKVISVNLPEVLISDLELILQLDIQESSICVCTKHDDICVALQDQAIKLILVPASFNSILLHQPIDLFVNIASFGEMTQDIIEKYFAIIKSSSKGAYLYCCNRLEKRLEGGEVSLFENYPWEGYSIMYADDDCPWHQQFYEVYFNKCFPVVSIRRPYDGAIKHRLVRYPPWIR